MPDLILRSPDQSSRIAELETEIQETQAALIYAVAQLRHAYPQLASGRVKDHLAFADGLIAPTIRRLEQILDRPR